LLDLGGKEMRILGATILISGICVAAGYLLYWFFSDVADTIPGPLKFAIVAAAIGFILLLLSAVRDRRKASKEEEQLKEVKR
jgi:membrane protein implicated in regulation of membrane protease activity